MSPQRHTAQPKLSLVGEGGPALDPLLQAAHASILDIGLRRTTLAEVARRAGVSRMTVYRQYGDRDGIVSALLTAELGWLLAEVTGRVAHLPTARGRLVEASVQVVRRLAAHPIYRRILDLDPELLLPLVVDRLGSTQRAAAAAIAEQVRAGRRDGSIRSGAPASVVAAHLLLALQSFVFGVRVLDASPRELRALVDGYLAS